MGDVPGVRRRRVMASCPSTGERVFTGLRLDALEFEAAQEGTRLFECPDCGKAHEWRREDVTLEDA